VDRAKINSPTKELLCVNELNTSGYRRLPVVVAVANHDSFDYADTGIGDSLQ